MKGLTQQNLMGNIVHLWFLWVFNEFIEVSLFEAYILSGHTGNITFYAYRVPMHILLLTHKVLLHIKCNLMTKILYLRLR